MAAVISTLTLDDIDGPVGKGVSTKSGSLSVELHSASDARRLATLLRKWADWVDETAQNPEFVAVWERT